MGRVWCWCEVIRDRRNVFLCWCFMKRKWMTWWMDVYDWLRMCVFNEWLLPRKLVGWYQRYQKRKTFATNTWNFKEYIESELSGGVHEQKGTKIHEHVHEHLLKLLKMVKVLLETWLHVLFAKGMFRFKWLWQFCDLTFNESLLLEDGVLEHQHEQHWNNANERHGNKCDMECLIFILWYNVLDDFVWRFYCNIDCEIVSMDNELWITVRIKYGLNGESVMLYEVVQDRWNVFFCWCFMRWLDKWMWMFS